MRFNEGLILLHMKTNTTFITFTILKYQLVSKYSEYLHEAYLGRPSLRECDSMA